MPPSDPAGEDTGMGAQPRPSSSNLVRFTPGDPRAVEAGRKGVAVRRERRQAEQAEIARRLEEVVEQHVERIAEIFESVLALEPDPAWKDSTKLDFRTRQISQIEKLLNRVEGLPVARQQVVTDSAEIEAELADLPAPVVQQLLVAALTAVARSRQPDVVDAVVVPRGDDPGQARGQPTSGSASVALGPGRYEMADGGSPRV
jgi:hypothetical protein